MSIFSIRNNEFFRHQWVEKKLKEIDAGLNILDVGCGTQQYKKYCTHLKYFAQDFGEYEPGGDGKALQLEEWEYGKIDYLGNCWEIAEKDETFDAIMCTEVIEHIPFPNETIKECARLLKKNGKLIITAPFASMPHMTPYYYYSGFYKNWFYEQGKINNLEVIEIVENGNIHEFAASTIYTSANMIQNKFFRFLLKGFLRLFIVPILNILSIKKDYIENILPYGYHVVLRKKGENE